MSIQVKEIVAKIIDGDWEDKNTFQNIYKDDIAEKIIDYLLNIKDEDKQLDYKENLPNNKKLGKLCSCFSNKKGGAIVFGIRENIRTKEKRKIGIRNLPSSFAQKLGNIFSSICKPDPEFQIIQFHTINNTQNFVIISFSKAKKEPIAYKGVYYKRIGDKTVPQPYEEISIDYPDSFIGNIARYFHIFALIKNEKINDLNDLIRIKYKGLNLDSSFVNFCNYNINDFLKKDKIIFIGENQSGKTTYSLKILKEFQQKYSKKSTLILVPKRFVDFQNCEIIRHDFNIIIFCDDIIDMVKKQSSDIFALFLMDIYNSCRRNNQNFHLLINFEIDEYNKIKYSNLMSILSITDYNLTQICKVDNREMLKKILSNKINEYNLDFDMKNEPLVNLLISKIKNNPIIGFVTNLLENLKHICTLNNSNKITPSIVQKLIIDFDKEKWFSYYKNLSIEKQNILKSIRLLHEFRLNVKKEVIRIISLKYYTAKDVSFNENFQELKLEDWYKLRDNEITFLSKKIMSVPLEYKGLNKIEFYKSIFNLITVNLISNFQDLSKIWFNKLGEYSLVYLNDLKSIDFAIQCFNQALQICENPSSFFGLGNCYEKKSKEMKKITMKKNYINKAMDYFKRSEELNPNSVMLINNIGTCYQSLALLEAIGNRKCFLDKAMEYYKKSNQLDPNFAVTYVNYAWNIYHKISERTQTEFNIELSEIYSINKEMIDYIVKGEELLPYLIIINEFQAKAIESQILFLKGKIHLTNGRLQENNEQLEIALKCFYEALRINPDFHHCKREIINVKYAQSVFSKFKDKDLLHDSEIIFRELIQKYDYDEIDLELNILKNKHGLLTGKKIKDVITDFIDLEKRLSILNKRIPKHRSRIHIMLFWIHILNEMFINMPPRLRLIYFKKYVNLNLKYLKLYPGSEALEGFYEGLERFLEREGKLSWLFIHKTKKQLNKISCLKEYCNVQGNFKQLIKALNKIAIYRSKFWIFLIL